MTKGELRTREIVAARLVVQLFDDGGGGVRLTRDEHDRLKFV